MSGTISFSYIPPNLRVPLFYTEFDNTQAGISQPVQRRLIIGQCITAAPSVPTFIQDVAAAQSLFGINSQLANMIAAFRANDPIGELWAVPFADVASSAAASGTVAFSGTATAAGTIFLYVGGTLVQVGVNVGDTAATVRHQRRGGGQRRCRPAGDRLTQFGHAHLDRRQQGHPG